MILGCFFLCLQILFGIAQSVSSGACGTGDAWSVRTGDAYVPLNNNFAANISGSSSDGHYSISVTNSRGTIVQGNRATSIVVNIEIPRTASYNIYNFIGSDLGGLVSGRAYCTPDGKLTDVWLENTLSNTVIKITQAKGSCIIGQPIQGDLYQVYDECLLIDKPATYPSIQGSQISLQPGETGSIVLNKNYTLLPFNVIDCKNCSSSTQVGWVEIHSLLNYESSASDICMGILYLFVQQGPVTLSWLNCIQPQQPNATFDATYDISNFNINATGSVNVTTIDAAATLSSTTSSATALISSAITGATTDGVTDASSNGLSTDAKIGIGVGIPLFILAIIAIAVLVFLRRRRRSRQHHPLAQEGLPTSVTEVSDKKVTMSHRVELDPTDEGKHTQLNEAPDSRSRVELDGTPKYGR